MADDFAIDKVIPDREHHENNSQVNQSIGSFRLSINNDGIESHFNSSNNGEANVAFPMRMLKGLKNIPGYVDDLDGSSGLITSDSNFEIAAGEGHGEGKNIVPLEKKKVNLKKDVSKTFKKMLRQNYRCDRENQLNGNKLDQSNESTKFGGSMRNDYANEDVQSFANSEIECKFAKKRIKKSLQKVYFKEDDRYNDFLRHDADVVDPIVKFNMDKKDEFLDLKEQINIKRPKDPFRDLNPLTQKVDITSDMPYQGSSLNDVFFHKFQKQNENQPLIENKFLMMAPEDDIEEEKLKNQIVLIPEFEAYQLKVIYEHEKEIQESASSENEDILQAQEQPYITTASISFNELLKQVPTKELAKRSDIMITSTLSISLFPKDKRIIMTKKRALLSTDPSNAFSIQSLIDEKNAFNALVKEHYYQNGLVKDKEKEYTDAYMKSSIHRSNFHSVTLRAFKEHVKRLNSNAKPQKVKDPAILKLEKIKFEQNKRAS